MIIVKKKASLPAWGVWIEINQELESQELKVSLPAWGVWIEIDLLHSGTYGGKRSLPAWGVWIEIPDPVLSRSFGKVAPRMGSVD